MFDPHLERYLANAFYLPIDLSADQEKINQDIHSGIIVEQAVDQYFGGQASIFDVLDTVEGSHEDIDMDTYTDSLEQALIQKLIFDPNLRA